MGSGSSIKIGDVAVTYDEAWDRLRALGRRADASTIDSLKDVYTRECGERVLSTGKSEKRYFSSLLRFAMRLGNTKSSLTDAYRLSLDKGQECPEGSPAERSLSLSDVFVSLAFQFADIAAIQRATHPALETVTLESVAVQARRMAQVLREKPLDSHDLSTLEHLAALLQNIKIQSLGERLMMMIDWDEKGRPILPYHFDHLVRSAGDVDYDKWEDLLKTVFTGDGRIQVEPYDLGSEMGFAAHVDISYQIIERIVKSAPGLFEETSYAVDDYIFNELATTAWRLSPRTIDGLLNEQVSFFGDPTEEDNFDDPFNANDAGALMRPLERFYNVLSILRIHSLLTLISRGEIQLTNAFLHVFQLWQWRPHVSVDILLHVAAATGSNGMKAGWIWSMLEKLHAPAHLSWSLKNHLDTEEYPILTVSSLDEFWEQLSIFLDPEQQRRLKEMDDEGGGKDGSSAPATPATGGAAPVSSDPEPFSASPIVTDFEKLGDAHSAANLTGVMSVHARNSMSRRAFMSQSNSQFYGGLKTFNNGAMMPQGSAMQTQPLIR